MARRRGRGTGAPRPAWLYAVLVLLLLGFGALLWLALPAERGEQAPGPRPAPERPAEPAPPAQETPGPAADATHEGIALIIDDVGRDLGALDRLLRLPFPITVSVLPGTPHAPEAARRAHAAGRTVMLHQPMEPRTPRYRERMGSWFLRADMDEAAVRGMLNRALARVPHAQGINNHMGSLLTDRSDSMRWVISFCRERGLFYVDSRTTNDSVAARLAAEARIPLGVRRVFLDHDPSPSAMRAAWEAAGRCQERFGGCIVIAHPHAETIAFLEERAAAGDYDHLVPLAGLLWRPEVQGP